MKKWLFMLSVIALSNLVSAMEDAQAGEDWEHVEDDPAQLVQDLIDIKKNDEWQDLDPMGTQIHGAFTIAENYPETLPSAPIPVPKPNETSKTTTLPASPAPSATSYSSAFSSSSNSQTSSIASAADAKQKAISVAPHTKSNSVFHQHSPVGATHTVAVSMLHMTSSIISTSSIETSANEDRGVYCHDPEIESDDDVQKTQSKKEKKKTEKKYQRECPVEMLEPSEFFLGVLQYMLGVDSSNQ